MIADVRITLSRYLDTVYVPSQLDLSPGTVEQFRVAIRLLDRWAGRPQTLHDLSEEHIRSFLHDYYATGKSPATVNKKRSLLLTLSNHAHEEGFLDRPPRARRIPQARECPPLPEAWTAQEVGRLLAAVGEIYRDWRGIYFRALILLLYDTGARLSEMLSVRPDKISLDERMIVLWGSKTGTMRLARIHTDTVSACRALLSLERAPPGQPPFSSPWDRTWLRELFKRAARHAGLRVGRGRGGVFHKLRRTSGSLIEANGGDGSRHLGNSRWVFEKHYRDPRLGGDMLEFLPRPAI